MKHLVVFCAVAVIVLLPIFAVAAILTVFEAQPVLASFGLVVAALVATGAAMVDWWSERFE